MKLRYNLEAIVLIDSPGRLIVSRSRSILQSYRSEAIWRTESSCFWIAKNLKSRLRRRITSSWTRHSDRPYLSVACSSRTQALAHSSLSLVMQDHQSWVSTSRKIFFYRGRCLSDSSMCPAQGPQGLENFVLREGTLCRRPPFQSRSRRIYYCFRDACSDSWCSRSLSWARNSRARVSL